MLVRLTRNLDCFEARWRDILVVVPGYVAGTIIDLNPRMRRKRVMVNNEELRCRNRKVVQFRLATGSGKLFALVSDIAGAYKPVPPHKVK